MGQNWGWDNYPSLLYISRTETAWTETGSSIPFKISLRFFAGHLEILLLWELHFSRSPSPYWGLTEDNFHDDISMKLYRDRRRTSPMRGKVLAISHSAVIPSSECHCKWCQQGGNTGGNRIKCQQQRAAQQAAEQSWDPGLGWDGCPSVPSCPQSAVLPAQPSRALRHSQGSTASLGQPLHWNQDTKWLQDNGDNLGFVFKFTASQCKQQRRCSMHLL